MLFIYVNLVLLKYNVNKLNMLNKVKYKHIILYLPLLFRFHYYRFRVIGQENQHNGLNHKKGFVHLHMMNYCKFMKTIRNLTSFISMRNMTSSKMTISEYYDSATVHNQNILNSHQICILLSQAITKHQLVARL